MTDADPYLQARYDSLNDSPCQRKFRAMRPMPIGCVFIEWPGMSEQDARDHFRLMRRTGFTCLKQLCTCPGTDRRRVMHWALDEGIIPWWYGEAGWEEPTEALALELGVPWRSAGDLMDRPEYLDRQMRSMRRRVDRAEGASVALAAPASDAPWEPMPHTIGSELPVRYDDRFVAWLRDRYGSPRALSQAWNLEHYNIASPDMSASWESWDQVAREWRALGINEFRHLVDLLLFKAEDRTRGVVDLARSHRCSDADAPFRAGGEMGMFLPFAARATDMEGIASAMRDHGSFYPSIHLAWHFEESDFEAGRCIYMQAALANDWFKGGWSATWESTGGPQQLSGGKAWTPEMAERTAGFTCDAATISQLMLSYVAAGFRGVGQWCWTARTAGWEAGEYALLDRDRRVTPRAERAGAIGLAMRRWRDELWAARKEPVVGIFTDFECEAMWAAIAHPNRDKYRHEPIRARIGASRALIDANVPFEYVTARNLRAGLAGRYRVIYLPAVIAIGDDLLEILGRFVDGGGRLVMDLPGCWYDAHGRLLSTGAQSRFARIFGASLDDFQYSDRNQPRHIDGHACAGWVADLTALGASVAATYQDGAPAVTEHHRGRGSAVILGWDASLACHRAGNDAGQRLLVEHALRGIARPYSCRGAVAYRLAAPAADHWFLFNDGPARHAVLDTGGYAYARWLDAVTGEALDGRAPIAVEARSARWLRAERAAGGDLQG
ncbi:MAG TPA: beta-galactosidase trimerization domain-containing protein [Planctomycetota bacterium]|nr:beta-galactosidase trimerization domain-containing protein [Planctomycetota bacterium]